MTTEQQRRGLVEDLVRDLVKFATHDGLCERQRFMSLLPIVQSVVLTVNGKAPECSCGLQKLYDRIDKLID